MMFKKITVLINALSGFIIDKLTQKLDRRPHFMDPFPFKGLPESRPLAYLNIYIIL
jgi:hypothetical protein